MTTDTCSRSLTSLSADERRSMHEGAHRLDCPRCGRDVGMVGSRIARHHVPTITVRLTRDELDAIDSSLEEHLAGDTEAFESMGLGDPDLMSEAHEKIRHAYQFGTER